MRIQSLPTIASIVFILGLNTGCNESKSAIDNPTTCKGNPNVCTEHQICDKSKQICITPCYNDPTICVGSKKCDTESGECIPITCTDNPGICQPSEECNPKGECQSTLCQNDKSRCYGTQSCDDKTGACIHKPCTTFDECHETEKCDTITHTCIAKSCLNDPNICKNNQKCGNDGLCHESCLINPSICNNNEKCAISGNCIKKESCVDNLSVCGEGEKCIENECSLDNTPVFCSDPQIAKFFLDHFELINNIILTFKLNKPDTTESCKLYLELDELFQTEGQKLCKSILTCNEGSSRTFDKCIMHYIQKLIGIESDDNLTEIKNDLSSSFKIEYGNYDKIIESIQKDFDNNLNISISYYKSYLYHGHTSHTCMGCETEPLLCKDNETCVNNNCVDSQGLPEFCSSREMTKFILDHYDIIHDLATEQPSPIASNAHTKLINLYNTSKDDLCKSISTCHYIDDTILNQCIQIFIRDVYLNDNLASYLTNKNFKDYNNHLCSIYPQDCEEAWYGFNFALFTDNIKTSPSTIVTCEEKPDLCTSDESCNNGECTNKSGTPRYCSYQPIIWFLLDHFDLINNIVGTDSEKACESYKQLTNLYKSEGKAVCDTTSGCTTGSDINMNKCLVSLVESFNLFDYSITDYINHFAPGYDSTKASNLSSTYGSINYDGSSILRVENITLNNCNN